MRINRQNSTYKPIDENAFWAAFKKGDVRAFEQLCNRYFEVSASYGYRFCTYKQQLKNDITLGTGQLNLPKILKAAQKTKIKYFYIEDENPKAAEQVPLSLAYLKSL